MFPPGWNMKYWNKVPNMIGSFSIHPYPKGDIGEGTKQLKIL